MLNNKIDYNLSHNIIDNVLQLMSKATSRENGLPINCYQAQKQANMLSLVTEEIDCCVNRCRLYYKEDANYNQCKSFVEHLTTNHRIRQGVKKSSENCQSKECIICLLFLHCKGYICR